MKEFVNVSVIRRKSKMPRQTTTDIPFGILRILTIHPIVPYGYAEKGLKRYRLFWRWWIK